MYAMEKGEKLFAIIQISKEKTENPACIYNENKRTCQVQCAIHSSTAFFKYRHWLSNNPRFKDRVLQFHTDLDWCELLAGSLQTGL